MPLPIQVPNGTVVLSNRFGSGPFEDCQQFVQVKLPQGVELAGVYNAARGVLPERFWLYAFALRHGQRSHTIRQLWAPTEKGAMAMLVPLLCSDNLTGRCRKTVTRYAGTANAH